MSKVILFDLGGVIFTDFFSGGETGLANALNLPPHAILEAYIKTDASEYCKDELGDNDRWKNFLEELNLPDTLIQTCIDEYHKSYTLIPETIDLLNELATKNQYRLGVLSDQPKSVTEYLRTAFNDVFSLFDPDLTLISAEILLSKKDPDQDIYKLAIERSGTPPQDIIFVDNSQHNIDNAELAGIKGYFFDIKNSEASILARELRKYLSDQKIAA